MTATLPASPERPSPKLEVAVPNATEQEVLASVETFLRRGVDLLRWWRGAASGGGFADRFPLAVTPDRPDGSFGFFDVAPVDGAPLPVMGNFQSMFYDRPKTSRRGDGVGPAELMRRQVREFVLHYFMRISDFEEPLPAVDDDRPQPPLVLRPFSWCPRDEGQAIGFGFRQLFYKRRATGEVVAFPPSERYAIVDLRRLFRDLEWIVVKVKIFDFSFSFAPFGDRGPTLSLPLDEESYLVLSRDFILDEDAPEPGELGHYGLGYAFIKNPRSGLLAYGPGEFDAAIELIDFHVFDGGVVRASAVFVANRPQRILNLPLDPFDAASRVADAATLGLSVPFTTPFRRALELLPQPFRGVDPVFATLALLNLATGGYAAEELCISRRRLDVEFLFKHFAQHYQTLVGTLQTWRQVPDWLDAAALPRWVVDGRRA